MDYLKRGWASRIIGPLGPYWLEPFLEITRVRDLTPGVDRFEKSYIKLDVVETI